MAIAFPLASMARSIAFPLTIRAFELGKSRVMLGGRPTASASSKWEGMATSWFPE
jgi:hypothetical protein